MANVYTGKAFATTLVLERWEGTQKVNEQTFSTLLQAFGIYPALTMEEYRLLDEASVSARTTAYLLKIATDESVVDYTVINNPIIEDLTTCPVGGSDPITP
jgi:hypothetical protein